MTAVGYFFSEDIGVADVAYPSIKLFFENYYNAIKVLIRR